eukprot:1356689-Pyramimonas_sp.AAC.2
MATAPSATHRIRRPIGSIPNSSLSRVMPTFQGGVIHSSPTLSFEGWEKGGELWSDTTSKGWHHSAETAVWD